MSEHEHYEALLMKAVDGVIAADEQRELDAHMKTCATCARELDEFTDLKETTDAMTQRILQDARIEPPRETGVARVAISLSFAAMIVGGLLLAGFAGYTVLTAPDVPTVVRVGAILMGLGSLGLLGYVLSLRWRARGGRDPYEEIDR